MILKEISGNYKKLRELQRGNLGEPAYSRFINRWLGRIFASVIGYFKISPNTISFSSFILTIVTFICFLILKEINFLESVLLELFLLIGFILDATDGQIARLLNKQSKKGEWFDHTLDAIKLSLGHGVAVFFIITHVDFDKFWYVVFLFIFSLAMGRYIGVILKTKLIDYKTSERSSKKAGKGIIRSILLLPLDYGTFIAIFIFTYNPRIFFIAYTALGLISILYSVLLIFRSWRELSLD